VLVWSADQQRSDGRAGKRVPEQDVALVPSVVRSSAAAKALAVYVSSSVRPTIFPWAAMWSLFAEAKQKCDALPVTVGRDVAVLRGDCY
jgi:hypothetical protein